MPKREEEKNRAASIFIPAGLFIGFAVGFLVDNIPFGIFGGLGTGFLMYALALMKK